MKNAARVRRWLAGFFLLLWCGSFLRMETTEKSIVRAVALKRAERGWAAELLYQFPEAAADAADAEAEVRSSTAEGDTPEQAVRNAARLLPKEASYRLCDLLFWDAGIAPADAAAAGEQLQKMQILRWSAQVFLLDAEEETDPEALLECAGEAAALAPRLHECADGMLLPVLQGKEDTVTRKKESILLTRQGSVHLSPEETAMAQLLQERKMLLPLKLPGGEVELRRCVVSVEAEPDGSFTVRLACQRKAGTQNPTEEQCRQMEACCVRVAALCWENGLDLLRLGAARALQEGGELLSPTKNDCPELRAAVEMLDF